jgi:membrane fusion protein (multidrug efflux system)
VIAAGVGAAKEARKVLGKTPAVVTTTAKAAVITNEPGGVGTLAEAPDNSFTVSVNLAGIQDAIISISQVDVTNGALVTAGTPLVKIDPTLLIQNAAQFQSQLTSAQQTLAADEQTPSSTVPGAQTQAQQVSALSVEVNFDANLVAIAQGKTTTLTAPSSGYVTGLTVQPGQVIGAGQPILELINPSTVDVSASLLLTDIQTIVPGDAADVVPTGLPGVQLTGTVLTVSAMTSSGGLDGIVVIQAQNTSPDPVPIGSQVFVHVIATQSAAVSVPAVAVMNSDLSPAVFVLRNGRAYFQPVTVGASDADRDQILTGLTAGEVVVEANMQSLTDGEKVRVLGTG